MKTKKNNSWLPADEIGYKKKFLTRVIQEKEAEHEIREFHEGGPTSSGEMSSSQSLDEERSMRICRLEETKRQKQLEQITGSNKPEVIIGKI